MSDFLTNLIQRALAPTSDLRPRLASRFEPQAGGELGSQVEIEQASEAGPLPNGETSSSPAEQPPQSPSSVPVREPLEARRTPVPRANAAQDTGLRPKVEPSSAPEPTRWGERTREPLPARSEPARESARPTGVRGDTYAAAPKASVREPTREPARMASRPEAAAQGEDKAAPPLQTRAVSSAVKPLEVHPRKAPSPRPRSVPAAQQKHAEAHSSAPSTPPDIHVTIGRVEVRAVVPPAPANTAAKPAPMLSLDEYLQKGACQ